MLVARFGVKVRTQPERKPWSHGLERLRGSLQGTRGRRTIEGLEQSWYWLDGCGLDGGHLRGRWAWPGCLLFRLLAAPLSPLPLHPTSF